MLSFSLDQPRDVVDSAGVQSEPRKFASPKQFQVESSGFCREVLKARMDDKMLHRGEIWQDVCGFVARPNHPARGVGGGFPCQA